MPLNVIVRCDVERDGDLEVVSGPQSFCRNVALSFNDASAAIAFSARCRRAAAGLCQCRQHHHEHHCECECESSEESFSHHKSILDKWASRSKSNLMRLVQMP